MQWRFCSRRSCFTKFCLSPCSLQRLGNPNQPTTIELKKLRWCSGRRLCPCLGWRVKPRYLACIWPLPVGFFSVVEDLRESKWIRRDGRPSFLWPLPMQNSQVKCAVSAPLLLLCVFKYQPRLALCQQSYAIHINAHCSNNWTWYFLVAVSSSETENSNFQQSN